MKQRYATLHVEELSAETLASLDRALASDGFPIDRGSFQQWIRIAYHGKHCDRCGYRVKPRHVCPRGTWRKL